MTFLLISSFLLHISPFYATHPTIILLPNRNTTIPLSSLHANLTPSPPHPTTTHLYPHLTLCNHIPQLNDALTM